MPAFMAYLTWRFESTVCNKFVWDSWDTWWCPIPSRKVVCVTLVGVLLVSGSLSAGRLGRCCQRVVNRLSTHLAEIQGVEQINPLNGRSANWKPLSRSKTQFICIGLKTSCQVQVKFFKTSCYIIMSQWFIMSSKEFGGLQRQKLVNFRKSWKSLGRFCSFDPPLRGIVASVIFDYFKPKEVRFGDEVTVIQTGSFETGDWFGWG